MIQLLVLAILPVFLFSSCKENNTPNPQRVVHQMPLLEGKNNIGMIVGFNESNPDPTQDSIELKWNEAVNSGMRVGRLQIDWPDLEPSINEYNTDFLKEALENYQQQGLQTFLLISVYDSEGMVVPDYLEGYTIGDEMVIERFKKLADWVIPMLIDHDGFLISISNEPDNEMNEVPGLPEEMLTFFVASRDHIHSIDEQMAVTITLTEGGLDNSITGRSAILDEVDIACWNLYGAKSAMGPPWYLVQNEQELRDDINRMIEFSAGKQIVIQELGLWSGNDVLNSSPEIQQQFFEVFFAEMESNDQIKAAFIFQLVDWSPYATSVMADLLIDEQIDQSFINAFTESLRTMGLIKYETGKTKPAWQTFTKYLQTFDE